MRVSRVIEGEIKNATVSLRGGRWFVSIQTEQEVAEPVHTSTTAAGIDRGVVNLATLSDGTVFEGAKPLKRLLRKLARQQRMLSRKVRFSRNWKKQRDRISRLHIKIADARLDAIHKATTTISKSHALVCLEDLRTQNMTRSARGTVDNPGSNVRQKAGLNRSILDMGWFETCRQLEYKQRWRGGLVILISPHHTSTTCSVCGYRDKGNRLSQSVFDCVACGHTENADINAAKNILAAGLAATACGGIGRQPPAEAGTGGAAMLPLLEAA
jgi:putative transposase